MVVGVDVGSIAIDARQGQVYFVSLDVIGGHSEFPKWSPDEVNAASGCELAVFCASTGDQGPLSARVGLCRCEGWLTIVSRARPGASELAEQCENH